MLKSKSSKKLFLMFEDFFGLLSIQRKLKKYLQILKKIYKHSQETLHGDHSLNCCLLCKRSDRDSSLMNVNLDSHIGENHISLVVVEVDVISNYFFTSL